MNQNDEVCRLSHWCHELGFECKHPMIFLTEKFVYQSNWLNKRQILYLILGGLRIWIHSGHGRLFSHMGQFRPPRWLSRTWNKNTFMCYKWSNTVNIDINHIKIKYINVTIGRSSITKLLTNVNSKHNLLKNYFQLTKNVNDNPAVPQWTIRVKWSEVRVVTTTNDQAPGETVLRGCELVQVCHFKHFLCERPETALLANWTVFSISFPTWFPLRREGVGIFHLHFNIINSATEAADLKCSKAHEEHWTDLHTAGCAF